MTYEKIVVLTGAGISAESGLKTFRGDDGLWEGHRVEDVATPQAFKRDPDLVYEFYNLRRVHLKEVEPNPAHYALAEFEEKFNGEFLIVTQNVDDLHERAGSKNLLHMHGELNKARCLDTNQVFEWTEKLDKDSINPVTGEKGVLRPHIVWFGEMPFYMDQISLSLRSCDLFLSIGTSGLVYPAAGFVQMVSNTCKTVEFNIDATSISNLFSEHIIGKASEEVPNFLNSLLS